ncbi:hypothetical protein YB2330_005192 [Saitoella coloradoensis]
MTPIPSQATDPKLTPFLLLAKSAKGKAAADLVSQATAAPGLYNYGELLETESIKALQGSKEWDMLRLFAYGTYMDYKGNSDAYPPLSDAQLAKLKVLTLVSLASTASDHTLPYTDLMSTLDLSSDSALRELIITAIYAGLIDGKMDAATQSLRVSRTKGRDIELSDTKTVDEMLATLTAWDAACTGVLQDIDDKLRDIAEARKEKEHADAAHAAKCDEITGELKAQQEKSKGKGKGKAGFNDDAMEIDEGAGHDGSVGSGRNFFGLDGGNQERKRKNRGSNEKKR